MPQSLALRDFPAPMSCVQMEYGAREAPQPQKGVALVFAYPLIAARPKALSQERYGELIDEALAVWSALVRRMAFFCAGYESKDIHPGGKMLAFENVSDAMAFCTRVQVELMHADWPEELLEIDAYRAQYFAEEEDAGDEFFRFSEHEDGGDDDVLEKAAPGALSKQGSGQSRRGRRPESPRQFSHVRSAAEFRSASMESDGSGGGRSPSFASSRASSGAGRSPSFASSGASSRASSLRDEELEDPDAPAPGGPGAELGQDRGARGDGAVLVGRGLPVKMGIAWGYPESIKPQSTTGRYAPHTHTHIKTPRAIEGGPDDDSDPGAH